MREALRPHRTERLRQVYDVGCHCRSCAFTLRTTTIAALCTCYCGAIVKSSTLSSAVSNLGATSHFFACFAFLSPQGPKRAPRSLNYISLIYLNPKPRSPTLASFLRAAQDGRSRCRGFANLRNRGPMLGESAKKKAFSPSVEIKVFIFATPLLEKRTFSLAALAAEVFQNAEIAFLHWAGIPTKMQAAPSVGVRFSHFAPPLQRERHFHAANCALLWVAPGWVVVAKF